MENASKALIIAGAILLSILIIAIGIYIFNQANTTVTQSMSSMTTQEKDAFNNEFLNYQGQQMGSNVKALLSKVSANFGTNKENFDKVPVVLLYKKDTGIATQLNETEYCSLNYRGVTTTAASTYSKDISRLSNHIVAKNKYSVQVRIGDNGIILAIGICDITNMNATQIATADETVATAIDDVKEKSALETDEGSTNLSSGSSGSGSSGS